MRRFFFIRSGFGIALLSINEHRCKVLPTYTWFFVIW